MTHSRMPQKSTLLTKTYVKSLKALRSSSPTCHVWLPLREMNINVPQYVACKTSSSRPLL